MVAVERIIYAESEIGGYTFAEPSIIIQVLVNWTIYCIAGEFRGTKFSGNY